MGNSTSAVAGADATRPAATTAATRGAATGGGGGGARAANGVGSPRVGAQQPSADAATMAAMNARARVDAAQNVPVRPAKLGDQVGIVDAVKEASARQRLIDGDVQKNVAVLRQQPPAMREGRYSIYSSGVALGAVPSVAPLDDCLRQYQHHYREARCALRTQRQVALPCNACYGGSGCCGVGGGNDARATRTNEALLRREQRTMAANLDARNRLAYLRAPPTRLAHSEPTTRASTAAAPLESLAMQTTAAAQEPSPAMASAQAANSVDSPLAASPSPSPASALMAAGNGGIGSATDARQGRALAIKTMLQDVQAREAVESTLSPVVQ